MPTPTPYIDQVPKDIVENLKWRLQWRSLALKDEGIQKAFKQAAFSDVLFWLNAFCWCFEPRALAGNRVRPFVSWPHQDPAAIELDNSIDESADAETPMDIVVDKSRGQGATWLYLLILLRRWLRDDMFTAGLVTRTESLVDSARDPDTLMWKIVWMIQRLPFWMLPEGLDLERDRSHTKHSLYNPENGATIVGYSATGDVARGGRKSVFAMDELAAFKPGEDYEAINATTHVTRCRWLVSTFKGDSGAYYDAAKEDGNAKVIVLDWKDNPTENRGLYRVEKGLIIPLEGSFCERDHEHIKRQHKQLRRRGYVIEGKIRNIWYNAQCLRPASTPRGIAQELDRDPRGSVAKVFSTEILKDSLARYTEPPLQRGRFVFDTETASPMQPYIVESEFGELSLWVKLDARGLPPYGRYIVGEDIGGGGGGSYTANSVASVLNRDTGEQVAEWASNTTEPSRFAYVSVALCKWFYNALLIPEANFDGGFFKAIEDGPGYFNMWMRETEIAGYKELTKKSGFWMKDDNTKLALFEMMQFMMASGAYVPRSAAMIKECSEYEWKNGKIIHVGSTRTDDEGAKGKAHSDRVIAASLSVYAMNEVGGGSDDLIEEDDRQEVPAGSMAERLREHDEREGATGDPWVDEGVDIFANNCPTRLTESGIWRVTGADSWI